MGTEAPSPRLDAEPAIPRHRSHADRPGLPRRSQADEPIALQAIVDKYRPLMPAFLTSLLKDRDEAEDVLQQCLVDVWRNAERYDPQRSSIRTWLLVICRSRALDRLRRRIPEPRDPATLSTEVADPDAGHERLLEQWRLADLLRRLPPGEAGVLRLRFYGGLSQSEISQRTGMPLGTVKATMVRGLRRLRELMEEDPA